VDGVAIPIVRGMSNVGYIPYKVDISLNPMSVNESTVATNWVIKTQVLVSFEVS